MKIARFVAFAAMTLLGSAIGSTDSNAQTAYQVFGFGVVQCSLIVMEPHQPEWKAWAAGEWTGLNAASAILKLQRPNLSLSPSDILGMAEAYCDNHLTDTLANAVLEAYVRVRASK